MGRKPKNGHRRIIEELLGENGQRGWEMLLAVAEGKMTFKRLAREPGPNEDITSAALIPLTEVQPSIKERMDAIMFMLEHLVGKPQVDVNIDQTITERRDLSTLPAADLHALTDILRKAGEKRLQEQVVDAEVVEAPALPQPEERVTTFYAARDAHPAFEKAVEKATEVHEDKVDLLKNIFRGKQALYGDEPAGET